MTQAKVGASDVPDTERERARLGRKRGMDRDKREQALVGYLFVLPSLVHLVVFLLIPLVFSLYLSFTNWRGPNLQNAPFIGLENYQYLFRDRLFWEAMQHTAYYTVLYVPGVMIVSLLVALVMNQKLKAVYLFRTLFYMPVISSWVAVSIIWITILDPQVGILNYVLESFGIAPVNWLGDPSTAMIAIVIISIWKNLGFQMVIWLAGLQAIPEELHEAAAIDGANRWHVFWHVIRPCLRETFVVVTVLTVINSLKVFDLIFAMAGTDYLPVSVPGVQVYTTMFRSNKFAIGSSIAIVLLVMVAVVIIPYLATALRGEHEV